MCKCDCPVSKSCPTLCNPMDCMQHTRLPCPSLSPGVCSNSCPLSSWYYPTISSFAAHFFSCPQSFPASRSFTMTWLFTSGGQSIGVSASKSALPMNVQDWFPLGSTVWSPCSPRDSQESSPTPQFKSINFDFTPQQVSWVCLSPVYFPRLEGSFKNVNQIMSLPYLSLFGSFLLHLE